MGLKTTESESRIVGLLGLPGEASESEVYQAVK